jgi:hypothetical protein
MVIIFLLVVNLTTICQEANESKALVLLSKSSFNFTISSSDLFAETDDDFSISGLQLNDLVNFRKTVKSDLHYLLKETVKRLPPCEHQNFLQEVISTIKQNGIAITLETDQPQNSSYYIDQSLLINKFISQDNLSYLKKMIKAGFAININNMQHAIMRGNAATNQLILDNLDAAKVNEPCFIDGANILTLAIRQKRPLNVIKTLINHPKIDLTATDAAGNNAYYYARDYLPDNREILELMQKNVSKSLKPKRNICCCLMDCFTNKYQNLDD